MSNKGWKMFAAKYLKYMPTEADFRCELKREARLLVMRRPVAGESGEEP